MWGSTYRFHSSPGMGPTMVRLVRGGTQHRRPREPYGDSADSLWLAQLHFGSVRLGPARFGSVRLGPARSNSIQLDPTRTSSNQSRPSRT